MMNFISVLFFGFSLFVIVIIQVVELPTINLSQVCNHDRFQFKPIVQLFAVILDFQFVARLCVRQ